MAGSLESGYREKEVSTRVRATGGAEGRTAHSIAVRGIVGAIGVGAWWRGWLGEGGLGVSGRRERRTYEILEGGSREDEGGGSVEDGGGRGS